MALDWRQALLRQYFGPGSVTPQNMGFLQNWQRWEGGHTNNSATYNWLNTTTGGPGAVRSINSVGVDAYDTPQHGLAAIANTIMNGRYPDIVAGLRSGNVYSRPIADDLSTWVSGSPTKGLSYAAKVTEGRAAAGGAAPSVKQPGRLYQQMNQPRPSFQQLGQQMFQQSPMLAGLIGAAQSSDPRAQTMAILGSLLSGAGVQAPVPARSSAPRQLASAPQGAVPGYAGTGSPQVNAAGGGWGGSHNVALGFRDIAMQNGLKVISEKRDTKMTASGGVSDHWKGSTNAYAFDLSNGSRPTAEMDRSAVAIMAALGVPYDGRSELVKNVNVNGYRVQVLYRTNVGGNHFNHIHVGVRKL